jgi:hypothetical protein
MKSLFKTISWLTGAFTMLLALNLSSCVVSNLDNAFDPANGGFVLGSLLGGGDSGSGGNCVFDAGNFDSCTYQP